MPATIHPLRSQGRHRRVPPAPPAILFPGSDPVSEPAQDLTHADGPALHAMLLADLTRRSPGALEAFMTDAGVAAILAASQSCPA